MFKRKNKTKQEILRIKGEQQENQPPEVAASNGDVVDGFDTQGFVDLTSEEHQPKLLGPQQNCKYVGTFPVSLGSSSDGETTLITHKERTKFVKKKLREYRYAEKGVKVSLLISKDGIKVITPDAQRVRMAHALQRISFATCDPEFRLFAYMSHNPSPLGTAIHCHVFMTRDTRQVQSLTAMVGKAFQVAFAESKFPQGAELKMDPIQRTSLEDRVVQGRRWARLEAEQGHEHSQHAIMARIKKEQEKEKNKSPNRSREEVIPKESSVITSSKTQEAPLGRQRSFGKARTPPQARRPDVLQQKNNVSAEATRQKTKLSDNVVADGAFDSSTVADALAHGKAIGNITEGQAVAEKKLNHGTNELHAQRDVPCPFSSVSSSEQDCPQTEPLPPTPPPKRNTRSEAASSTENLMMSPLAKSASDPNLLNSHSDRKHVRVSRHNSHEDENWYLPGIPREFVTEMLQQAEEGSFFVRDSHSKPGCFALTMRVPREANPSGFANFLIVKVKDGVMIQVSPLAMIFCFPVFFCGQEEPFECALQANEI